MKKYMHCVSHSHICTPRYNVWLTDKSCIYKGIYLISNESNVSIRQENVQIYSEYLYDEKKSCNLSHEVYLF